MGSDKNVDPDGYRSRIRRFVTSNIPKGGLDFSKGEVFADGLRNTVGLAFDSQGTLWGVENGADKLYRSDLGGDIHNENPAEELNKIEKGKDYGYPFCFTEFKLPAGIGKGRGSVWSWSTYKKSDAWCRANTVPPVLAL